MSLPDQAAWFNSIGTYDHTTVGISSNASIGIDLNGKVSATIGLNVSAAVKSRSAELEIYHKP